MKNSFFCDEYKRQKIQAKRYESILKLYNDATEQLFSSSSLKNLGSLRPDYNDMQKELERKLKDAQDYFCKISESYIKIVNKIEEEINKYEM